MAIKRQLKEVGQGAGEEGRFEKVGSDCRWSVTGASFWSKAIQGSGFRGSRKIWYLEAGFKGQDKIGLLRCLMWWLHLDR